MRGLETMNRIILLTLMLILNTSCGENEIKAKKITSSDIIIKYVNGKPLECLSWSNGVTCNWEKHNDLID